ncbi:tRNA (adenosine(37)-N6)-threonylcarbamoyltransferase complex ATPase subunit type 1 TsaE [Ruegeria faecimaris]|uniref:tRNA (adenosine(37)-N6)-threonylcarbamoyltransferase complex ATPase subunit type 1 TsaE n=1 Tax=Ruegeria faecimaris TaxID=686389 RepID=UPI002492F29B|nr:tRNA (adenosine(37)-N6)-threonylcarbamoyltransferase complex ATPase subunit type 1 TsaE [Ruegeria faecimaris]
MTLPPLRITLNSPEDTTKFASRLGAILHPGDILLLQGEIGTGKTHFARSLIQSLMTRSEDVPSPTFTLVQVYDTRKGEIWHCDLYRLSAVEEVEELGLAEAMEQAICLIEWPEKLGLLTPGSALTMTFETDPDMLDMRHITLTWTDEKWAQKLEVSE